MKKSLLVSEPRGYINKKDITNVDPRFLVPGSQNVLIVDSDIIKVREGYTVDGTASTDLYPIISSYDWITKSNTDVNLRAYLPTSTTGVLQYRYVDSAGTVTWRTLMSSLTSASFNFTEWWSTGEAKKLLIFANGTSSLYMWTGAVTTYASSTVNTITKEGTSTWAVEKFLQTGTRTIVIGGITYTYTGGEGTTTLTGVTPDPTGGGHVAGDVVHQGVRTTATTPASTFDNDLVFSYKNYLFVGDFEKNLVYASKNTDYTDFSAPTSPRLPAEAATFNLRSAPVAFVDQEDSLYISASRDEWYQVKYQLSSDQSKEAIIVDPLKSGPGQGAVSQSSTGKAKNSIIYVNNEKTVDTLGRIESVDTPQSLPLSDPIKNEILDYDFTIQPDIKYFKGSTYITFPSENKVLIFDHDQGFWQPPQILPVRRWAVINGELYGHSSQTPTTFKMFVANTYNDNEAPIDARAAFAYRNYGRPDWQKVISEWFSEGYISTNTTISLALKFDFGGSTSIIEKEISGTEARILFATVADNSLGKYPLGSLPLGSVTDSPDNLKKFRCKHELTETGQQFFEVQAVYSSNEVDYIWQLLRNGGNATLSTNDSIDIKI